MSLTSELGISPVLLQAITHTLASRGRHASGSGRAVNSALHVNDTSTGSKMNVLRDNDVSRAQKVVAHILQDMNEPVSALLSESHSEQSGLRFDGQDQELGKGVEVTDSADLELLRQRLDGHQGMVEGAVRTEAEGEQIIISESDVSMVNVLTAIASHHLKAGGKDLAVPVHLVSSIANKMAEENNSQPQYVVCYGGDEGTVPSPAANDIVVSEAETSLPVDYMNMRKIYVNQNGDTQLQGASPVKRMCLDSSLTETREQSVQSDSASNGVMNLVLNSDMSPAGSVYQMQSEAPSEQFPAVVGIGGMCPICGDRVSGYHYGIFSCESCKGFFKRTVQNKKSFSCMRSGDCEVNISNRKKCPACRFQKCLVNGMKLEAIRSDRTRGGRSYYDGCSPHGKSKPTSVTTTGSSGPTTIRYNYREDDAGKTGIPGGAEAVDSRLGCTSSSQLVAILNRPSKADSTEENPNLIKPYVPQVLTDIMNLESLLSDEDLSQEMGQEKISEDEMYISLMQLTELRLYKLVRWARNLPQFSAIATDDQILLLQHCWSDLLVLGVCWPSIQSSNELRLAFGKSIDREKAIAMDIEDIFERMMSLTAQLRRLHVDNYEFVTLKVLILISPDVKGLKDPDKIRDQQDKICDALHVYTASHYPKHPNKFGEMLLRLPEISRCSLVGKEYLSSRQITGDLPSCSLLLELIRGENEVKDT